MIEITQEMIDFCRDLGTGRREPHFKEQGLCSNFRKELYDLNGWEYIEGESIGDGTLGFLVNFSEYPNYSGYPYYPVYVKDFNRTPESQYDLYLVKDRDMYDPNTKYGKERRKFCLWCADELERKMREQA